MYNVPKPYDTNTRLWYTTYTNPDITGSFCEFRNKIHGSRTLRLRYAFWQFRDDSIRLRDALILSGKTIVNVL